MQFIFYGARGSCLPAFGIPSAEGDGSAEQVESKEERYSMLHQGEKHQRGKTLDFCWLILAAERRTERKKERRKRRKDWPRGERVRIFTCVRAAVGDAFSDCGFVWSVFVYDASSPSQHLWSCCCCCWCFAWVTAPASASQSDLDLDRIG